MKRPTQTLFAGIAAITIGFTPLLGASSQGDGELYGNDEDPSSISGEVVTLESNALLPIISQPPPLEKVTQRIRVTITAYSSTPDQTDDTPFITAAGTRVRDGIVAANMLPIGTKLRIPELYGEKIFVVEDRMHPRNYGKVDVWFPNRWEATRFGVKNTHIEILEQ